MSDALPSHAVNPMAIFDAMPHDPQAAGSDSAGGNAFDPSGSGSQGVRAQQRQALHHVLTLGQSCQAESEALAQWEAEQNQWLKRRHQQSMDRAKRAGDKLSVARSDSALATQQLHTRHESAEEALDNKAKAVKKQLLDQLQEAHNKTKEEWQHAQWVEDNVLEAAETHANQQLKKHKQQAMVWDKAIEDAHADMAKHLAKFPKALVQWPEAPPPPQLSASQAKRPGDIDNLGEGFDSQWQATQKALGHLKAQPLAGLFAKTRPYLIAVFVLALGAVAGPLLQSQAQAGEAASSQPPTFTELQAVAMGLGASVGLLGLFGWALFAMAKHQCQNDLAEAWEQMQASTNALALHRRQAQRSHDQAIAEAKSQHQDALAALQKQHEPLFKSLQKKKHQAMAELKAEHTAKRLKLKQRHVEEANAHADAQAAQMGAIENRPERLAHAAEARLARDQAKLALVVEEKQNALQKRWQAGRDQVLQTLKDNQGLQAMGNADWQDPIWQDWVPAAAPAPAVRFGQLTTSDQSVAVPIESQDQKNAAGPSNDGLTEQPLDAAWQLPTDWVVPALLSGPDKRSLLIQTEPSGRDAALNALRSVMLRLLASQPAGHVKFTLIDPVGLGETFAGFMHLADFDPALVGLQIWSEPAQIDQRLLDLTDHLSTVIQKHLRNAFDNIDDYNRQAGELAEPYRFVVVADHPHGLSSTAIARLNAIAQSGPRCGVFVLAEQDLRQKLPPDVDDDLAARCATVRQVPAGQKSETDTTADAATLEPSNNPPKFVWQDPVYGRFDLTLDGAPEPALLSRIVQQVGEAAIDASRVQVPFETIAPGGDTHPGLSDHQAWPGEDDVAGLLTLDPMVWSKTSGDTLVAPIGRSGATRLQQLEFGKGVAQHALVAGKTGSGKSSLIHTLVTNMCLWYSPDELALYLIDFKKGVEFKPYVEHRLPHARAIAIESDRAFGLSILKRLDQEMDQRGEMYRKVGAQNVAGFREKAPDTPMPRVLLVVDEFQELFAQDDDVAQQAATLLDRLVRQGRAFGVHALLGSQSLSGAAGLAMGTMSQMAIRIALMCGEADSQLILGDDNTAARLLARPGEAIYNDQSGQLSANSLFQVAWLPEHMLEQQLKRIAQHAKARHLSPKPCAVFEGSAPSHLANNIDVRQAALAWPPSQTSDEATTSLAVPKAMLGEPVAIADAVGFEWPRFAGANGLIVGQQADSALNMLASGMTSLATQHTADGIRFVFFNGSPDPEHTKRIDQLADALPQGIDRIAWRDVSGSVAELHAELQSRLADDAPRPLVCIAAFGLHRLRDLKKQEESFSFSLDDDAATSSSTPDQQFADLLRDGPGVGIHVMAWCDRAAAVEQVLDRKDMRHFDQRVLFQMSANDSAMLIDTPDANDLGPFRALLYRDDLGTLQVFRPYDWPDAQGIFNPDPDAWH